MTPNERRAFVADQRKYDQLDNIAFLELINPKVKYITETGGFTTAFALLQRLKNRSERLKNSMNAVVKAIHLLQYLYLVQKEGESSPDFVDRKRRKFLVRREMGIDVDDSLRFTKFIQHKTANMKHKSIADQAQNPVNHKRSKHIRINHHWIR